MRGWGIFFIIVGFIGLVAGGAGNSTGGIIAGVVFFFLGLILLIGGVKKARTRKKEQRETLRKEQEALDEIADTGELPVVKVEDLPRELPVILKKDESLHLWRDTVTLYQKKSESYSIGGGSLGISMPSGIKGVRIHPRVYGGRIRETRKVLQPIDSGDFILTNQRFIFRGQEKSIDVSLKKISSVDIVGGLVSIARQGKEKIELFETNYPTLTAVAVKGAAQKAAQT